MLKHIHLDRCDSTQDILKEQLSESLTNDLLVSCEHQENGRGRGTNSWSDTPGTICFSMTVTPHAVPSFTALEISLLVCRFFETKNQFLKLKWPNDIMNSDLKKCAGILVQNSGGHMIAGVGMNLFFEESPFGGVYSSSFEVDKKLWSHEIASFIRDNRYADNHQLANDWNKRCFHLNARVRITEGDVVSEGVFLGLGNFGEALLETSVCIQSLYNGSLRLV